jgi:capsular polysaccharide export protein
MNKIGTIKGKNVLFLQGPMGLFFKRLDSLLKKNGATTYKIGFNAGDSFFSNHYNYIPFRDKKDKFEIFITNFFKEKSIDKVFLFGDCRFYQSIAISVAKKTDVEVFVFEEGYIRPNYITMEKFGVNAYSSLSRKREFYSSLSYKETPIPSETHQSRMSMFFSATLYYFISNLFHYCYPNYEHHRDFSALKEFFYGMRSFYRKIKYKFYEKRYTPLIQNELMNNYFFVPLQTYNDFQVLQHSGYKSIEKFIIEVIESFSANTSSEYLIFKHHPVDRGRKDYREFIESQARGYDVESRVIVLYDTYLPMLLQNAKGTITINSTVGLSSLYHGTPTITLGNALYDIEGLTSKGMSLDNFWSEQRVPDLELLQKYRAYLIEKTQLNGSFYGDMPKFNFD